MNLEKMLNMQKVLDDRIIKEKSLEGPDLFPNTILALIVELSEFANEGRWFKHWSNDQEPRTKESRLMPCSRTRFYEANPLLEEYVDSVHFFLSISNQKGWQDALYIYMEQLDPDEEFDGGLTGIFLEMSYFLNKCYFENPKKEDDEKFIESFGFSQKQYWFRLAWILFLDLGINGFGFTLEQIEEAYMKKNEINHARQDGGY